MTRTDPPWTPDRLRALRARLAITQRELAAELGITSQYVSDLERGVYPIRRVYELALNEINRRKKKTATGLDSTKSNQ